MTDQVSHPPRPDGSEPDRSDLADDPVSQAPSDCDANPAGPEQRAAPRFTLLIRAAKLITPQGEFVCVIRDVSESGISVRLFHKMPTGSPVDLQMPSGQLYRVIHVWDKGNEAGFEFDGSVNVAKLIGEASEYPKRGLRVNVFFPISISTFTKRADGLVANLSQQGARFETDAMFAIDQSFRIEALETIPEFKGVTAKVRWRREQEYGVVFDDTFTLGDFARLVARLQAPGLLSD